MSFLESIDKNRLQKILLVVIAALVLALLVCLVVIIISGITPPAPTPNDTDFELKDYTLTDKDVNTGSLILADTNHPYTYQIDANDLIGCGQYRNENLPTNDAGETINKYYMNDTSNMKLTANAMAYAHNMLVAAEAAVMKDDLLIEYAYGYVGDSEEYKTALLIALANFDGEKLDGAYSEWFASNAAKYGFIQSFEDAYRYVGEVHAKYMTDEKLTLANYIDFLKKNTNCDKAITVKIGDAKYSVYYAEGKSGDTVKVPATAEYTVSGTNEGGIIVTVKNAK